MSARTLSKRERTAPVPVLYFTGGLRVDGMETHLLHLVERLDRSRYVPHICCLFPSEDYRSRIAALGVEQSALDIPYLDSPARILRLREFLAVLRRVRPGILQTYGYTCDVVGTALARTRRGVRVVTTRRGEDRAVRHQRFRSFMNRFTDCVICVSEQTERFTERTESLHGARLTVIPNGVVLPRIQRTPGERLRFGTLGTVKEIKGTDLLVDAFLQFPDDVAAELIIGGRTDHSPDWASALMARAEASPLGARVRFLGHQSDIDAFYSSIDVFVLPSRSEGMSNSLLEAMAAGLPCIATDVGSNRAVLRKEASGLSGGEITEVTAAALHEQMAAMLEDPAERTRAGSEARRIIERFYAMEPMVRAHEALYDALMWR